eukprot:TRINITY_DN1058_c0_g1_i1.p1 TRINITY_DN1058_c0_g1~~TRINITY_DN1058_c0_g1_i1.p1  ORF type:complete len:262 (+),score=66.81 TRINITY_DN1058_c0_g1_i1:88-873(+)
MSTFQIKLSGAWSNYEAVEDRILKRAFMAGFPNAKFQLRGQNYQYDFSNMVQRNLSSGKERQIRPPLRWRAPKAPIVPAGPTMAVNVPPGSAGKTIHVPHPKFPEEFIVVQVPKNARAGQTMLVPVPMRRAKDDIPSPSAPPAEDVPAAVAGVPTPAKAGSKGWSTGAKVAGGLAGAGAVVGGVLLGAEIAEHGVEATMEGLGEAASAGADAAGEALGDAGEAIGEFAGHAGEAVGDFAVDAGAFFVDAADSAGDFIMDLF